MGEDFLIGLLVTDPLLFLAIPTSLQISQCPQKFIFGLVHHHDDGGTLQSLLFLLTATCIGFPRFCPGMMVSMMGAAPRKQEANVNVCLPNRRLYQLRHFRSRVCLSCICCSFMAVTG